MSLDDWLEIGTITKAHGIQGVVRLRLHNPESQLLQPGLLLRLTGLTSSHLEFHVQSTGGSGEYRLIGLSGVTDRNTAQRLAGSKVSVLREVLPPLQEGEFYQTDLLGLPVLDRAGRLVGHLEQIYPRPGSDIWIVVTGHPGEEILIPATEPYILKVDLPGRQIVVDKLEELAE